MMRSAVAMIVLAATACGGAPFEESLVSSTLDAASPELRRNVEAGASVEAAIIKADAGVAPSPDAPLDAAHDAPFFDAFDALPPDASPPPPDAPAAPDVNPICGSSHACGCVECPVCASLFAVICCKGGNNGIGGVCGCTAVGNDAGCI